MMVLGCLSNFGTLRVGAYSRWAFIQGWALTNIFFFFLTFSASEDMFRESKTKNNKLILLPLNKTKKKSDHEQSINSSCQSRN